MASPALRVALLGDLVADAPHDDRRVVAIAADHVADVALAPLVEELAVAEARLVLLPLVERLVHHHEAQAIGEVEECGCGRVVARADGIHAHGLHDLKLALESAVERRGAERPEIVMEAHALERDVPAVQQELAVGGEFDGAEAERDAYDIAARERALHGVEIRILDGPAMRFRDLEVERRGRGACPERSRGAVQESRALRPGDLTAFTVPDHGPHAGGGLHGAAVLDRGAHFYSRAGLGDVGRPRGHAPGGDVYRRDARQPHVPVDAGAGVPARRGLLHEHAHGQHIGGAGRSEQRRDVELEARVPVWPAADALAVQPHFGVHVDALEFEPHALGPGPRRQRERLAIPADAAIQVAVAVAAGRSRIERALGRCRKTHRVSTASRAPAWHDDRLALPLDHEVVRKVDAFPPLVVECGRLAVLDLSRFEAPVEIKELPIAWDGAWRLDRGQPGRRKKEDEREESFSH